MLAKKVFLSISLCSLFFVAIDRQFGFASDSASGKKIANGKNFLFMALESALRNNREILSIREELKATHEARVIASSGFRPTLALEGKVQTEKTKRWQNLQGDRRTNPSRSGGLVLKQNLYHGGKDVMSVREVDAKVKASWENYEAKKQLILRDISIVLFSIIAKKEEASYLRSLLSARKENIEVAERMLASGAAREVDVAQAKAGYAETEAKLAKAVSDCVAHCAQFEEMTGCMVPDKLPLPEKLLDDSMPEGQAIDIAFKNNPALLATVHELDAARASVKKTISEFLPSLDATYSIDQTHTHSEGGKRGQTFALSATFQIYDGGVARSDKRKAEDLAVKASVDKEKVLNEIKTQMLSCYAALKSAKQNLKSMETAVNARNIALSNTQQEYKAGLKIMKDVLDAQEQLFEVVYMKIQAENEYFSTQCKILALLGRMNAKFLKITDSDFDYRTHYAEISSKF
ncbi:MAG: TolC family protein [Holosporales bacterium]|nr:TolC family protein [Holosporales bacterium]